MFSPGPTGKGVRRDVRGAEIVCVNGVWLCVGSGNVGRWEDGWPRREKTCVFGAYKITNLKKREKQRERECLKEKDRGKETKKERESEKEKGKEEERKMQSSTS